MTFTIEIGESHTKDLLECIELWNKNHPRQDAIFILGRAIEEFKKALKNEI